MLKKVITYTDYDGNERKENFFFNLTKAELAELELTTEGGYQQMVQNIVDAKDTPRIVSIFKEIILKSYGQKSDDGKRFIKSEQLTTEFTQTEAYSQLFMELVTDPDAASAFISGVVPSELSAIPAENA